MFEFLLSLVAKKSTKIWEEQGEYSPLEATINGLLVKVSLRFNEEDEDKSCETSAVALKSTKKWNFSKRKKKLGRYARHSTYYKSSSTCHPAAPTTQSDCPPPPSPVNLATRCFKRKISKADIASQLTSSLKLSTLSESKLQQEIAEKILSCYNNIGNRNYDPKTRPSVLLCVVY